MNENENSISVEQLKEQGGKTVLCLWETGQRMDLTLSLEHVESWQVQYDGKGGHEVKM